MAGSLDIIFDYVDRDSFTKYFRLVIIVCGYLFFRGLYQNWANKYHIKKQIERDEQEKKEKPIREEKEKQKREQELNDEAQTFGWGKKTRRDNKLKEAILEQQVNELRERHQNAYDAAEDHDIEDLLED